MPIRIGLYDFFAYTFPGIFCLAIIGFWLDTIDLLVIDFSTLNNLSLAVLLGIIGTGYIIGLLIEPLAYALMKLFSKKRDGTKVAFDEFKKQHPWVKVNFEATDLSILLRAVKSVSMELAANVEEHNVAAIMLMNMSFAFVLSSISSAIYYFVIWSNLWILILALTFLMLAIAASRRSRARRHWFYKAVFETFTAHFLLDKTEIVQALEKKSKPPSNKRSKKTTS